MSRGFAARSTGRLVAEPTSAERRVLDLVTADEVVELTRALVRAPGENPPGGEGETVAVLAEGCASRGIEVATTEVEPGRPNLLATSRGGDGPGLLLLGHTDVVPVGDGWTADPVGAELLDGRVVGRGSSDMKGGLAALVVAMSAVRRAGVRLSGPVELAAVVDEEETGKGVRHYLDTADRSGFAGCLVAEPTDLQTVIAARGDAYLCVRVTGKAAHAGNPADGANAIYGAAAVVGLLEQWHHELADRRHPLVGPGTWNVGLVDGGTGTSVVPAEASVTADRRLLPDETADEVLAECRHRLDGLRLDTRGLAVEATVTMEMPGFETPGNHPMVMGVDGALSDVGGPGHPLGGWSAACDGGFVARDAGLPVVVLGPGSVTEQAHRSDESVGVAELLVAARAYALAIVRLLGDPLLA